MIPILYKATETEFKTNGLGRMADAISCTVTEERNGQYELEMTYPIAGTHYSDIAAERIVFAVPSDGAQAQPFDIYEISRPLNGIVTVRAQHISYRLKKLVVAPFTAGSPIEAMEAIQRGIIGGSPFTFSTDKRTPGTINQSVPVSCRSILGGMEGSLLHVFGGGEYEFDRLAVRLHTNRGHDNGVTIRYGKDLTGLEAEMDIGDAYTSVVPYWERDGVTVIGDKVESEHAADYACQKCVPMDFTEDYEQAPTKQQLEDAARAYMERNSTWQPTSNVKVSFQPLWQTEEYKDTAVLQRVRLCDTVKVVHDTLGVTVKAKVIKTVYDVLAERYISIELGDARQTLSQAVTRDLATKNDVQQERSARQAVEEQLQKRLAEASGFYTTDVPQPDKSVIRYVHDKPTLEASMNVIKITAEAIGFSTDGGQTYPFGLTVDGKTIMGIIATEGLYADWMETGVLQSKADASGKRKFYLNLDTGDVDMEVRNLTIAGQSVNEALAGAVVSVEQQFYLSDSPTALAGSSWSNTQPAWMAGRYIWSRQYVRYGDGTDAYLPSKNGVCITGNTGANGTNGKDGINGKDGVNGKDGRGVLSSMVTYQASVSGTDVPEGAWSGIVPTVPAGQYLWTRTVITYTDSDSTTLYTVSRIGADGAPGTNGINGRDGINGKDGENGVGVKSITNYYLAYASASGVTVDTAGWSINVQSVSAGKPYLWNYEVTAYTDGTSTTVAPHIVGTYGRDGTNGTNGTNGKGIRSITEHYLATSAASGVTTSTAGWSESLQQTDTTKRYLWNYETITYTDGSTDTVAPRIIGTHGTNGKDGTNGEDGVGIESVEAEYILSPSDQSPTEDPAAKWSTTIPPAVEGMYIWTRQKITYTDGTVEYAGQYCMSRTMGDIAQQKVDAQTQEQIFDKLTNNGQLQGLFMQDGYLYINARYLRGDTIDLNMLKLAGTVCGLMQGTGMTGNGGKTTVGIVLYGNGSNEDGTAKPPYLIVTNEGIRLQLKDGWPEECVYFSNGHMQIVGEDLSTSGNIHTSNGSYGIGPDGGHPAITFEPDNFNLMAFGAPYVPGFVPRTWLRGYYVYVNEDDSGATYIRGSDIYASKSIQVNSDARLKKDIEPLPEACERMLDHLSPVAYRYKRETDDAPKHWGYTTQDVEAALRAAGLDRPDMAALGQYETEDGERYMALAYEELIAALHLKVKSLEARMEQIEEGMKNGTV